MQLEKELNRDSVQSKDHKLDCQAGLPGHGASALVSPVQGVQASHIMPAFYLALFFVKVNFFVSQAGFELLIFCLSVKYWVF